MPGEIKTRRRFFGRTADFFMALKNYNRETSSWRSQISSLGR